LGVNFGRVGFLAEADRGSIDAVMHAIVDRDYLVDERMTVEVTARLNGSTLARTWALNEASVEKSRRERLLDVVLEVDRRPVSGFGCDGVLCATPTGSTAYAFSAGGPVVWPDVDALVVVPSNAHALFAKPLVVSPDSVVAVEVDPHGHPAVLCCDGRRTFALPAGARIEVVRGATPIRLVRLHDRPFTDRLVRKFELPVQGWRGPRPASSSVRNSVPAPTPTRESARVRAVITEMRIEGLGVIDEATLDLHPGLTVVTGETGAGKTMVVTGLQLLAGGRADVSRIWRGADRATVEGRFRLPSGSPAVALVDEVGARADEDGSLIASRTLTADGRSRAYLGGRSVPAGVLADLAQSMLAVHGQNDQLRLLRPGEQRALLDRFAGDPVSGQLAAYRRIREQWLGCCAELAARRNHSAELAAEADLLGQGLTEITAVDPQPGEDAALLAEARRLADAEALRETASIAQAALSGGVDGAADGDPDQPGAIGLVGQARR